MKEDLLQFIWRYKRFDNPNLLTTSGQKINIVDSGQLNLNAGPDFSHAQIQIGPQLWAGNVELHVKSSDWRAHNHDNNPAYRNVILHVVWVHNEEVLRRDGTAIDTLELSKFVNHKLVNNYERLISSKSWINCENDFSKIDVFTMENWLERLFIERLEQKSKPIFDLLDIYNNDWEQVLFILLFKSFGLKVNSEAFESTARSIDFNVVRKIRFSNLDLEALFFGQSNLFESCMDEAYYNDLKDRYVYLKHKFKITASSKYPVQFFRLRPANFPTLRLSQLAGIYYQTDSLFNRLMHVKSISEIYEVFEMKISDYWRHHYNFSVKSKKQLGELTKSFMNLIIINTIVPLRFVYMKKSGNHSNDALLELMEALPAEKNSIVDKFKTLREFKNNALVSQGLLKLKTTYCDRNACLSCALGTHLLLSKID